MVVCRDRFERAPDKYTRRFMLVPAKYGQAMRKRKFGYQFQGFWGGEQIETVRDIPPQLRESLDIKLLARAIPDHFSEAKGLVAMFREICKQLPNVPCRY